MNPSRVPDLIGGSCDDVAAVLTPLLLNYSVLFVNSSEAAHAVIAQEPPVGTQVGPCTVVDLTCSIGIAGEPSGLRVVHELACPSLDCDASGHPVFGLVEVSR